PRPAAARRRAARARVRPPGHAARAPALPHRQPVLRALRRGHRVARDGAAREREARGRAHGLAPGTTVAPTAIVVPFHDMPAAVETNVRATGFKPEGSVQLESRVHVEPIIIAPPPIPEPAPVHFDMPAREP